MSDPEKPQIYLCTPRQFELSVLRDQLASILDTIDIACLRLGMDTSDEQILIRAADELREVAHARDVPLVIETHYRLVTPHGLDGVHLMTAAKQVRDVRKELHKDAIIGAYCGNSRHAGMNAGEIGADYISFGPVSASELLGDGKTAEPELFQWWSEMIEVPVVAETVLSREKITELLPFVDFFCLGEEIWTQQDPIAELKEVASIIQG